ncbi:MAG: hypothetical protein JXA73_07575 [Acidobacteria bacterium]|nr:hypothetical protein [Acidobacteriota bacterium]
MVIVSGIQPSGNLHLGNYFGAVQQFIQFTEGGHECCYFLANCHFRSGGLSYREVKQAIFDRYMQRFGPARARRKELVSRPDHVDEVLRHGVERARKVAAPLIRQVRETVGISYP